MKTKHNHAKQKHYQANLGRTFFNALPRKKKSKPQVAKKCTSLKGSPICIESRNIKVKARKALPILNLLKKVHTFKISYTYVFLYELA